MLVESLVLSTLQSARPEIGAKLVSFRFGSGYMAASRLLMIEILHYLKLY